MVTRLPPSPPLLRISFCKKYRRRAIRKRAGSWGVRMGAQPALLQIPGRIQHFQHWQRAQGAQGRDTTPEAPGTERTRPFWEGGYDPSQGRSFLKSLPPSRSHGPGAQRGSPSPGRLEGRVGRVRQREEPVEERERGSGRERKPGAPGRLAEHCNRGSMARSPPAPPQGRGVHTRRGTHVARPRPPAPASGLFARKEENVSKAAEGSLCQEPQWDQCAGSDPGPVLSCLLYPV